jgi:hypothetical protein
MSYGGAFARRTARVRFDAIGEAWRLFNAQAGAWLLAGLIVVIGNWAVNAGVYAVFGHGVQRGGHVVPRAIFAGSPLNAVLAAVINGFFVGGMFRMACLQLRGQRISAGDLFSVTDVLAELFLGSALFGLACFAGGLLCIFPAFIVAGVLMFTLPLIVDARLRAVDAISESWHALKGEWFTATVFHFLVNLLAGLGFCCFCVGLLFTMPLYCLSIAVLYRDTFLVKDPFAKDKPVGLEPEL